MIYLITGRKSQYDQSILEENGIQFAKAKDFKNWITNYDNKIQLDTETNIVVGMYGWKGYLKGKNKIFTPYYDEEGNRIPEKRKCYVVQVGDFEGKNQWIFDVPSLNSMQTKAMYLAFTCSNYKLIHNALFDYSVVKWCFGIDMKNLVDTMLMSKSVTTGLEVGKDLPSGYNSLAGCCKRFLNIDISKAAQTSFTGEVMDVEQIIYAATDVAVLGPIYEELEKEVEYWEAEDVAYIEAELQRSYGDAMCENLYLDADEWQINMDKQFDNLTKIKIEFEKLVKEYFLEECKELKLIQPQDEYKINWRSSSDKKNIMKIFYPELPEDASKIKDYKDYKDNNIEKDNFNPKYIDYLLSRDFESIEQELLKPEYKSLLKKYDLYCEEGKFLMNLNSTQDKLSLFQLIKPNISSTNKDVLKKIKHPISIKMQEYNKASKLATSYGQNFLDSIDPDGMFRVKGFTSILDTGRSSMSQLQLLPGDNTYRNPFKPNNPKTGLRDDGHKWVVVGADYASQEAVVAATFAKEETLLKAIEEGCDFHSTCTSLMFPDEWKAKGGDPKPKGKPKDKDLLKLRQQSKAVSFGPIIK